MRITSLFLSIILLLGSVVLSSCSGTEDRESSSYNDSQAVGTAESAGRLEGISDETLSEYKEKHHASVAVIDMLIPQQALLVAEDCIVKLVVLEGITGETVIPRDSIARMEKTEIPGAGMVTVKIVDKIGKEISFTLTPKDAESISE